MLITLIIIFIVIPAIGSASIDNRVDRYTAQKKGGYAPRPGILIRVFRTIFWLIVIVWLLG